MVFLILQMGICIQKSCLHFYIILPIYSYYVLNLCHLLEWNVPTPPLTWVPFEQIYTCLSHMSTLNSGFFFINFVLWDFLGAHRWHEHALQNQAMVHWGLHILSILFVWLVQGSWKQVFAFLFWEKIFFLFHLYKVYVVFGITALFIDGWFLILWEHYGFIPILWF